MSYRVRVRGLISAGLIATACAFGQGGQDSAGRIGLPYDWSHQHTIFAQPDTFERLSEVQADPRYWQQLYRSLYPQNEQAAGPEADSPAAVVDWSESLSTTALTFTGKASYPAKYSFNVANPTPNCTGDYVVLTLPTGTATQANLFAFNNLYVNNGGTGTCAGTTPKALFAYNASQNAGKLNSSPVLSLDGTKIALIENATPAQFHVVKWTSGDTSSTFGKPWNSSVLPNCATNGAVAPCEYSVVYSNHAAALSSPYVDYASDTAYVSDNHGLVVAISPVFGNGTPAVVFSVAVSGRTIMTPPVYDSVSKNVFAADAGGFLYYIRTSATSSGSCASGSPPCVGATTLNVANGTQVVDAPIVDSASGTVFVFSKSAPSTSNSLVVQTTTTLSTSRVAFVGPNGTLAVHTGAFNNAYYSSPASGLLYVCGTNSSGIPQLFAISFTGTQMNTGTAAHGPLALAEGKTACSPMSEVFNQSTSKDYLFLGVARKCSGTITGGCIEEFDVTSGFPSANIGAVAESAGTTGIVIDNVRNGATGNPSQTNLYFGTLGAQSCTEYTGGTSSSGNCLVKLTQTGLQ